MQINSCMWDSILGKKVCWSHQLKYNISISLLIFSSLFCSTWKLALKYRLPTLRLPCHNSRDCRSLCQWESARCFRSSVPCFRSVIPLVFISPLDPAEGFLNFRHVSQDIPSLGSLQVTQGISFSFLFVGKLFLVDSLPFTWSKVLLFLLRLLVFFINNSCLSKTLSISWSWLIPVWVSLLTKDRFTWINLWYPSIVS